MCFGKRNQNKSEAAEQNVRLVQHDKKAPPAVETVSEGPEQNLDSANKNTINKRSIEKKTKKTKPAKKEKKPKSPMSKERVVPLGGTADCDVFQPAFLGINASNYSGHHHHYDHPSSYNHGAFDPQSGLGAACHKKRGVLVLGLGFNTCGVAVHGCAGDFNVNGERWTMDFVLPEGKKFSQ